MPIITTTGELFKSNVNKPGLKNFILVIIAIALCPKFRINEISRHLGVDVKTEKTKQKRLLRFLDRKSEKKRVMGRWATFVLEVVYRQSGKVVPILIDETDLIDPFSENKDLTRNRMSFRIGCGIKLSAVEMTKPPDPDRITGKPVEASVSLFTCR